MKETVCLPFLSVSHQQVLDQLSHTGCSLCWLLPIGCQLDQCRQEVPTFLHVLDCFLTWTGIARRKFNFSLKRNRYITSHITSRLKYSNTHSSVWSPGIDMTHFAQCYRCNCGPSCLADCPLAHWCSSSRHRTLGRKRSLFLFRCLKCFKDCF